VVAVLEIVLILVSDEQTAMNKLEINRKLILL
jgi:hypothetical protein